MYQFFKFDKAELYNLMQKTLNNDVKSVSYVETGWTNIVADAQTSDTNYIFRFPRNPFWATVMVKDCLFCELIYGKMPLETPDIKLIIDKNRPFSVHKKIQGRALSDAKFKDLSRQNKEIIANECALFLKKLHEIPPTSFPVIGQETLNDFLIDLAQVHKGLYDYSKHNSLKNTETNAEKLYLVHGDFNPGNVLVGDNNHVAAIIDFAFVSLSVPESDVGRFWGRTDDEFGALLTNAYDDLPTTRRKCSGKYIEDVINLFRYVDKKYTDYLRNNEKSVKLCAL